MRASGEAPKYKERDFDFAIYSGGGTSPETGSFVTGLAGVLLATSSKFFQFPDCEFPVVGVGVGVAGFGVGVAVGAGVEVGFGVGVAVTGGGGVGVA